MPTTGLPRKYENVTLSDYQQKNSAQKELAKVATNYIDNLDENRKTGQGLAILGPPGLGKTMISCIIVNGAVSKGYSVRFTTLAAYVRLHIELITLRSAWEKMGDQDAYYDWQKKQEFVKALRNKYDFLVIDDIGKEHTTGTNYAEDEFDFLLRRRAHLGLPVILTSNYAISDWSAKYSASMSSFLREVCDVVGVVGKDYRKENYG